MFSGKNAPQLLGLLLSIFGIEYVVWLHVGYSKLPENLWVSTEQLQEASAEFPIYLEVEHQGVINSEIISYPRQHVYSNETPFFLKKAFSRLWSGGLLPFSSPAISTDRREGEMSVVASTQSPGFFSFLYSTWNDWMGKPPFPRGIHVT